MLISLLPNGVLTGQMINQANWTGMDSQMNLLCPFDQIDEIADRPMSFDGVTKEFVSLQRVLVLSAHFFSFDESPFFQVRDNTLNGSFRDADTKCHFAENHGGILRQQDQNV
jgi:hypothetical protein